MDEESLVQAAVFWAMLALNSSGLGEADQGVLCLSMKGFWSPGVPEMKRRVFEFSETLKARLPKLAGQWHTIGVSLDFLVSQWFSTLFGYVLPEAHLPKALDVIFTMGWPGMMTVAIAMLASEEHALTELDEVTPKSRLLSHHTKSTKSVECTFSAMCIYGSASMIPGSVAGG